MHTKGRVNAEGRYISGMVPGGRPNGEIIAEFKTWNEYAVDHKANAKHCAALWNAADDLGLTTEAIEGGIVQEMVDALLNVRHDAQVSHERDNTVIDGGQSISVDEYAQSEISEDTYNDIRAILAKMGR